MNPLSEAFAAKFSRKNIRVWLAMAVTLSCIGTKAATENELTFAVPGSIPYMPPGWTSSLTIPQFDPSLGTLEMVSLDLRIFALVGVTLTNSGSSDASGYLQYDSRLSVRGGFYGHSFDFGRIRGGYNYFIPAGQSVTYPVNTYGALGLCSSIDPADLNAFTGTGTVEFGMWTSGGMDPSPLISDMTFVEGVEGGTVTFLYIVPEPCSLALISLGALMLCRKPTGGNDPA